MQALKKGILRKEWRMGETLNKKFKAPSYNTFKEVRNKRNSTHTRKEDGLNCWVSVDVGTIDKRESWKFC